MVQGRADLNVEKLAKKNAADDQIDGPMGRLNDG